MMKYIILIVAFCFGFLSCEKPDRITDLDNFSIGAYLQLVSSDKTVLDFNAIATESVSIKVKPIGSALEKINIYAVKGGENIDPAKWKLVKSVPVTDSVVALQVTAPELAAAFGGQASGLKPGEQFVLYNEMVTKDGRTFNVANSDDDLEGQPAFNSAFRWGAAIVCPFDNAVFNGAFEVVEDGWGDLAPGDEVQLVAGPSATQFTIVKPYGASNKRDIVVDVNKQTGVATVAAQAYGDYPGFPNVNARTAAGGGSFAFSCTGEATLNLTHFVPAGTFGTFRLTVRKK